MTDNRTGQDTGSVEVRRVTGLPVQERRTRVPIIEAGKELVRELVRAALALFFVVILGLTLLGGFSKLGTPAWSDTKEFLGTVLPAETALLGAAVAFFFATDAKRLP